MQNCKNSHTLPHYQLEYEMVLPHWKTIAESVAKLLHDITTSASILCGQAAFEVLKLALTPPSVHAIDNSPEAQLNVSS